MLIQKILHSCILIETGGQKLLIDPGDFCFVEGLLKPEDIPAPDVLLLTHEHSDHFFPEAFPKIFKGKKPQIITHGRLAQMLKEKNYESTDRKSVV